MFKSKISKAQDDFKTVGIIPIEVWNKIVKYELRQWVIDNADGAESDWDGFLEKVNNKIKEYE